MDVVQEVRPNGPILSVSDNLTAPVLDGSILPIKNEPMTPVPCEDANLSAFKPQKIRKVGRPKLLKNCNKEKSGQPNMAKHSKSEKKMTIPDDILENKTTEISRFWAYDKPLQAESIKVLRDLLSFYTDENLEKLIVPRSIKSLSIQKKYELSDTIKKEIDGISLRAVEWLVTNYSKGIKIVLFNEKTKKYIDIHNDYEIQSNYFKRNSFDPFCRHNRIYFFWKLKSLKTNEMENVVMLTTIAQLNFFKWAHENGILEYASANKNDIQGAMESVLSKVSREKKLCKQNGIVRKRRELTRTVDVKCNVYSINTDLHFDLMDCDFASDHDSSPLPKHHKTVC
jgi:hypothetical protein